MADNQVRIFKIASEINIGKDAIVAYLKSKGFDVENKPTALLTEDMVEAVYDKFKRELKAAEKQREKVEKLKSFRKPQDIKPKSPVVSESEAAVKFTHSKDIDFIEEIIPVVKEKLPKHHRTASTDVSMDFFIEPVTVIKPEPKIDKSVLTIEEKPTFIIEEKPTVIIEQKPVVKIEEKPVVKIEQKPVIKIEQKQKDEFIVQQIEAEKKIAVKEPEAKERKIIQLVKQQDLKKDSFETRDKKDGFKLEGKDSKPEGADSQSQGESRDSKGKKKKKRRRVAEVEIEASEHGIVKGLRIVGKIDLKLDKDRPKKEIRIKPAEFEEEDEAGKAKSKLGKLKKKAKGVKGKITIEPVKEKLTDKKKRRKKSVRDMISEEEVERAIRETLSGMGEASGASQRSKMRQRKKVEREEKEQKAMEEQMLLDKVLSITEFVTTSDLADLMGVNPNEIILKCLGLGLMVSINQRLDKDTITLIADDYGIEIEFLDEKAIQLIEDDDEDDVSLLLPRSPIVTIMGHVDHGKTSLLDFVRKANVVAGEAGGITQHIGAYQVLLHDGKHITFLDTPGHEAFTAMRARGALVTDIVVLVVAADDSVMPQTIEAISHAQAANVPIIVAINKMDKGDANPDRIKQQLTDHNVLVEDWGGKNQSVEISAKKGINVDILLEKILLEAELLELKANPDRMAKGTVIEANMDKGLGPVATVIIQKGTLKIGDYFVTGIFSGRVRAMFDERGNKVYEAGPSMPVRVIGFNGLPVSGDLLHVVEYEYMAREIANDRSKLKREQETKKPKHVTLDDISKRILVGEVKELNLIIKGDVGGSVEALSDSLLKLSSDEVRVNILHKGVGSINESDVMLAVASGVVIIGFQVNPTNQARKLADNQAVDIRLYNIIYDCINEVKLALEGLLAPEMKEDITSQIEVRKVYKISRIGAIAGCYVLSGKITRNDKVRVLRDGLPIFTGSLTSLKRGKDDVREVETNYECGIMLDGFNSFEPGDMIESFKIIEIRRTLS